MEDTASASRVGGARGRGGALGAPKRPLSGRRFSTAGVYSPVISHPLIVALAPPLEVDVVGRRVGGVGAQHLQKSAGRARRGKEDDGKWRQ